MDMDLKTARNQLFDRVISDRFGGEKPGIIKNDHGKPFFEKPWDGYHFNISHSGDIVVMGIGRVPLGVDVERIGRVKDFMRLLRFFYDREKDRVRASADPEDEFYRIWTYREAFSKLVGEGLALYGRNDIEIDYDRREVSFTGSDSIFYEYEYPGYRITLCVPAGTDKPRLEQIEIV